MPCRQQSCLGVVTQWWLTAVTGTRTLCRMLVALPVRTFGDVAALGLNVAVHCPRCHRVTRIDPADIRLCSFIVQVTEAR